MQIPIIQGIYTDENSDFRTSYPRNLVPVPKSNGISSGYLRPAEGIVELSTTSGLDRGGINWNGSCYRVIGTKLVRVSDLGVITELGEVGGTDQVSFDYSFDRLAVASNNNLFYWDVAALTHVTDADLGTVLDVLWIDGYFMTTDGENLVVTELADPTAVNPLKYGSSELDPDPIVSLLEIRNEVYAINRYTIEVFTNVGGSLFPFQRIDGAQITKGAIGTHACCKYLDAVAFIGGDRNDPLSVWIGQNGSARKISTREVEQILHTYTETQLESVLIETRSIDVHEFLYIHLPDKTLVYDASASGVMQLPIWHVLTSGIGENQYTAKNFVWCYNKWIFGHPAERKLGTFTSSLSSHWGDVIDWEFGTAIIYNEANGVIFHELELIGLTGRAQLTDNPKISTSYSLDGEQWSQPKTISAGTTGERTKRLIWLRQGRMSNWRIQRFNGTSDAMLAVARLEARIEALVY